MSVSITDVRGRCGDIPYLIPDPGATPESLGEGDGTTTTFFLANAPYTGAYLTSGNGVTVWQSSTPGVWTQVATGWSLQNGNQIVFISAPAANVQIGARYYFALFADSVLQSILTQAIASPICTSDDLVLYKCQFDAIGMILMDRNLLMHKVRADISDDPAQIVAALTKSQDSLSKILFGKTRPGTNVPSVVINHQDYISYTPPR